MNSAVDSFNAVEVVLWLIVALVLFHLGRRHQRLRGHAWSAASLFVLFGISDLVELQTGAWWQPWWLLAWKALCLVGLLAIGLSARRVWKCRRPDSA